MVKQDPKKRKGLLKQLKETFAGLSECEEVDLKRAYRLEDKPIRLPLENYPIQLNIGADGKALHIYPEQAIGADGQHTGAQDYIIFDPKSYYEGASGFMRIKAGEKLVLGKEQTAQEDLLNLPQNLARRHLSISNDDGRLSFKSYDADHGACIAPLLKEKQLKRIRKWRQAKLKRLRAIFGGPLETLPPDEALALIRDVNSLLENESYRAKDETGKPGGVIELPAHVTPLIVGDLHTKLDNLLVVLSQSGFLKDLKNGHAALVIIGDAVHCEEAGQYEEMDSSILIMDMIFKLKLRFPQQVFYLRGNHDSFSEEIGKQGVPQGLLWGKALEKTRGTAYRDQMARFYDLIPYIIHSPRFISCHAGPPTRATSRQELINIRSYPQLAKEVTNNRVRRSNKPSGYSKKDVKKFRKYFDLEPDTPLIVGHTPVSMDDTLWERVGEIDDHYVVYSADNRWVGAMTQVRDRLYPFRYPAEPLIGLVNASGD